MLKIEIDDQSYSIPSLWSDISLKRLYQLEQLCAIEPTDPLARNRELLSLLGDIPRDIVDKVVDADIERVITHFVHFIEYVTTGITDYTHQGIRAFTHNGKQYLLPEVGVDIMERPMPGHKMIAVELCSATDIALLGGIHLASCLIALICRPKAERYNEDKAKQRAKEFGELSADIFFEAHAYIGAFHEYQQAECPECYPKRGSDDTDDKGSISSWCDRLLFVADNRPSELSVVESMMAYDFMRIMNSRIKMLKEQWRSE